MKQTEIVMRSKENVVNPLNIDQALDARDAIAKSLYTSLFTWLVNRINKIMLGKSAAIKKAHKKTIFSVISVLDMFGFEEFSENSFEQLCINFANETLQHYFNKNIFKLEQAEYAKEKLEWTPIQYNDNQSIIHMISKKPIGVFHLLDDESNFPKASDLSFLEKCHYNHALNELYSRPRMSSMDFGIKHYAGQVWYNVEGFLDKNRDTVRYDVMGLLISSKDKMISKMFLDLRNFHEASKTLGRMGYGPNHGNGQFITMKPRAPTVAARFGDSLSQLFSTISQSHPFFIRCIKPNSDKCPMKFDMPVVLEQLRYTGLLETIRIRKLGYPIRYKYNRFVQKYRCLLGARVPRGAPTKEVARVILDRYVGTYHQDNYALGASKVFLRESMEGALETERQDIQEVEVVKLQQHVRGYLARKRYLAVKESTIKIQSAFRGHQVRQKYTQMRRGVVALQSIYRMRRQQSIYGEMKVEMIRRKELEKEARLEMAASKGRAGERNREKNRHTFEINRLSRSSLSEERRISTATSGAESSDAADDLGGKTRGSKAKKQVITHRAVTNVNHLDIPAQLAFILSKLDTWKPVVHMEKSLAKVSGQVPGMQRKEKLKLPHDIDYYVFSKVASVYFKSHLWQMKREPIQTPFLSKSKESDYNDSLAIFKLILRFMNDDALESGKREKVLGDYIVNQGISNQKLRDEILCQLANQTWKNDNIENAERGWLLMANCLSAFGPSKTLHKYLLKYVSDHAPTDGFRAICQQKLLRSAIQLPDSGKTRAFPPTILEWRANKKRVNMALPATCTDDPKHQLYAAVDSFSTAEEFAANILADRNVAELQGWTVSVEEGDTMVELSGGDFILDGLGEIELPPAFPVANKTSFLVTTDRSRGQLPLIVDTEMLLSGHHPVFSPEGRESQMGSVLRRNLRAQSHDRILAGSSRGRAIHNEELGLSSRSALNDRYFEDSRSAARSKSLDNLVDGQGNFFGLSESKLNKRYLNGGTNGGGAFMSHEEADMNENLDSISQRGGTRGRGEKWRSSRDETLGLSNKTPLNDRYFSQPDLIGGELEEGPTGQDRSRSSGNLVRGNILYFLKVSHYKTQIIFYKWLYSTRNYIA
jgi:myosin-15